MNIILDDGFQFGLGFFETIAVENGNALFLKEHMERLNDALTFFHLRDPISEQQVTAWLKQQPDTSHHALKVIASSENLVMTLRVNPYDEQRRTKGFRMDYSNVIRNETSPFVYRKSLNYGDCILEKRRAASLNLDELIFLNSRGEL